MNYRLFRRDLVGSLQWRYITKIDGIDVCAVLRGSKQLPVVEEFYKLYIKAFPNLPRSCPIMPGKYSAKNVTFSFNDKDDMNKTIKENQDKSHGIFKDVVGAITPHLFPNGYYKNVLQFTSAPDPDGYALSWITQSDFRMNEDSFK